MPAVLHVSAVSNFLAVALIAAAASFHAAPAAAQSDGGANDAVAAFYKGKQMRFVIRSAAGSGFDLYSRLVARNIVNHIPGKPTIVPQNMPGAGGITAAHHVGEIAPKDGTVLTLIGQALVLDQALGFTPTFKADLSKFNWIGNISDSNLVTYLRAQAPAKTMLEARNQEIKIGGVGAGDLSSWMPDVYNNVLGTKFKIIGGYQSGSEVRLAMERGEVEGFGASAYSSMIAVNPRYVKDNIVNVLVQIGVKKEADLPDVPLLTDLARSPQERDILEFISKGLAVGRPIGTGPDVPADRVVALRKAFDEMLKDPAFIADAEKQRAEIGPMDGQTVQELINFVINSGQELKDRVKAVMPPR